MVYQILLICHFAFTIHANYHDDISISFQPHGYYLPTSWIEDTGNEYTTKTIYEAHTQTTRSFTFGWNQDLSSNTWHIDISNVTYTHKYIETGITLKACDPFISCDIWNIQLENGFYFVEIGLGQPKMDPDDQQPLNQSFHYSSTIISENEEILSTSYKPTNVAPNPSKWLHIGSKIVEVTDNKLSLRQESGSFGTNLDYVIIKRIKCGDINTNFELPQNTKILMNNYSIYYPSTVPIVCDIGFNAEPINLKCNLDGKWMWDNYEKEDNEQSKNTQVHNANEYIFSPMKCVKVDCGKIDQALLAPYYAHVYWQEYTHYNSLAIVICNSKDVNHVGELICKETGHWKWKEGKMKFLCPSFTPIKNIKASVFSQYLQWFIVAIIIGGLLFIFVCLHVHKYLYNKYNQLYYNII